KKTEKVYLAEFSKNVEVIERNIQSLLPNPPLTAVLSVPQGEEAKYLAYFTNQGFEATITSPGKLSFSVNEHIQAEQTRRAQWEAELKASQAARELWWQANRW